MSKKQGNLLRIQNAATVAVHEVQVYVCLNVCHVYVSMHICHQYVRIFTAIEHSSSDRYSLIEQSFYSEINIEHSLTGLFQCTIFVNRGALKEHS